MDELSRRRVLERLAITSAGAVALAGCVTGTSGVDEQPHVVTNNPDEIVQGSSFEDALGEDVTIQVLVYNPGPAGDVEITVSAHLGDTTELAAVNEVFEFDQDEQKNVSLAFRIPSNAEYIEAVAERVE